MDPNHRFQPTAPSITEGPAAKAITQEATVNDTHTTVRRTLQLVEYSDGDCIVTQDTYTPDGAKRTSREIYRTSALPAGLTLAAERYLLAENLPALLAVLPEATHAVTLVTTQPGRYALTFWRSLPGDTAANAIGSHVSSDLDQLTQLARDFLAD